MIRNILWQMDGALFDTYPALTYAISRALNELGRPVPMNAIDVSAGQSLDACCERLAQRLGLAPELLRERFTAAYAAVPLINQPPRPGVKQVCALIHDRGGHNIALTHRSIQSASDLLNEHGLARWFDGAISAEQGLPRQPDLALVEAALQEHRLGPAETMLVSDNALGIQAGRSAGVRTCLFGQATNSQVADHRLETYMELLDALQKSEGSDHSFRPGGGFSLRH